MQRTELRVCIGLLGLIGVVKFTVVLEALKEEWYLAFLDNATDIIMILVLVYVLLGLPRQA